MRFLHLSDLHIGKRVNEFSMLEDQADILAQILEIADERQADGVWIAGDVYDKSAPSAEAVQLFDWFLTQLAGKDLSVFVVSGNHDSAERIAFGAHLLDKCRVYLSPVFSGKTEPVLLRDAYGEAAVYLLPFLKPAYAKRIWPESEIDSYSDAVRAAVESMDIRPERRNILIAHQFVTGAARCESEEVSVGGVDNVDAAVFDPFDYVALGHIHSPQWVGRETVRYCGTPLKYSFSEARQQKSVTVVTLLEKGRVEIDTAPLIPRRDMREIRGTYLELTARSFYQDFSTQDYIHATLTDEEDVLNAVERLRTVYPNLMKLDYDNRRTRESRTVGCAENVEEKTPMQLLEEFYRLQNNQPMNPEQEAFAAGLMEKIWEGQE